MRGLPVAGGGGPLSEIIQTNLWGKVAKPYYEIPKQEFDLTYVSFGAGVQSTAMLICSALGWHNVPRADFAIFADPQAELPDTYKHIEFMTEWAAEHGIEVINITRGSLKDSILESKDGESSFRSIPLFVANEDGKLALLRRQCTREYKIDIIKKVVRERLGLRPRQVAKGKVYVRAMLGISLDEVIRMRPSRESWVFNDYPLIDAGLNRENCKEIIRKAGIEVPPKSSCWFCPFHSDDYWRSLRDSRPEIWKQAVDFDRDVRQGLNGVAFPAFLHRSLVPLDEVELGDRGEGFGNECSGVCGV